MNKFNKIAIVAAGVALIAQGAQAAFTVNDLYLGFTSASAANENIIDLGQASTLINSTGVTDLSSDLGGLTAFNTTFNNSSSGVNMGVVGGDNVFNQFGVFATQVRAGGATVAANMAGSTVTATHSSGQMSTGAGRVAGVNNGALPTAGHMVTDSASQGTSYLNQIEGISGNTFFTGTGVQPAGAITGGIVYEDLYAATTASAYAYKGYFTFDYNNDSLTFTSAAVPVPEPTTYGLFAGAGLLVFSLRRQFRGKAA